MRAGPGRDVSGVALELGGGGHPRAAGCTLSDTMSAARERVLGAVEKALSKQKADSSQPRQEPGVVTDSEEPRLKRGVRRSAG